MKKSLMFLGMLSVAVSYAQEGRVGVNTETPNATLEVAGVPTNANVLDGIIAPRLTGAQLGAKTYTTAQTGAVVYVTAAATNQTGQVVNVADAGYYYFDGTVWVRLAEGGSASASGENIYTTDGTLPENRVVTEGANTLTFTGTAEGATKFVNTTGTATAPVAPLQILDGAQAQDKVLTSDANGNATWEYPKVPLTVIDLGNAGMTTFNQGTDQNMRNLGVALDVPPGKWWYTMQVGFEAAPNNNYKKGTIFLRVRALADDESSNGAATLNAMEPYGGQPRRQWYISKYAYGAKYVSTGLQFNGGKSTVVGSLGINNTTGQTKRFYLYADLLGTADAIDGAQIANPEVRVHTGTWAESTITVMPVAH